MFVESVTYREEAKPSDREDILDIVRSSHFFSRDEMCVAVELVEERLRRGLASGYYFLFAESGGRTVGYTCYGPIPCTESSYDLYWIAVHDDFRGFGVGKQLLERTEAAVAGLGGSRIYVETSSRSLYEPTRLFYRKCGYGEVANFKDFYSPGDHKVVYVKVLSPVL